jgi:hypothetical protein
MTCRASIAASSWGSTTGGPQRLQDQRHQHNIYGPDETVPGSRRRRPSFCVGGSDEQAPTVTAFLERALYF